MRCFVCMRPAKWRASMVVRSQEGEPPVLHEPRLVCELHRDVLDRVPDVAVQKRIEAEYKAAKEPVPNWLLSQLVFEPVDPKA